MCKSQAEGGQHCASHTRPIFEAATPGTAEWDEAAAQYATTDEGIERLTQAADDAGAVGDEDQAAALRAAINRGDTLREANGETARLVVKGRKRIRLQDELDAVAAKFGVGAEQVRRDHLIFFGGTALSRIHLPNLRL